MSLRRARPGAKIRGFTALACAFAFLLSTAPARAAAPPGLVVVPHPTSTLGLSYFKLNALPGHAASAGTIELLNPSTSKLRVALTPVSGETLDTLGSSYAPPGTPRRGSAAWLHLGARAVTLLPHRTATVSVSLAVPRHMRPGDYLAGVSVETLHQQVQSSRTRGESIASVVRYAIGVEVSLLGARHPRIEFTGARLERQPSGLVFVLLARNPGNVILQKVHGAVRITRGGRTVVARPIEAGTFVSGTSIAYPVPAFGQSPAVGTRYAISAWLRYAGGIARLHTGVTFGHHLALQQEQYSPPRPSHGHSVPWPIVGVLAGAILYGAAATTLLLRRRWRRPAGSPVPAVGEQRDAGGHDRDKLAV